MLHFKGAALVRPQSRFLRVVRLTAALAMTLLVGCVASQIDAAESGSCEPPREFHVVAQGWHASLLIRGADLLERLPELTPRVSADHFLEFGWGDAQFYRSRDPTAWHGLRALLYPTDAVLHVVAVSHGDPAHLLQG